MLTAIIFILISGLLISFIIGSLNTAVKKTSDTYLYEQAQLLAKSATEYAILAAQGHNYTNNCLNAININYQNTFDINITLSYIGNGLPTNCNILHNAIVTKESNGTVIVDTRVSLNKNLLQNNTPITYVRRTLQKL